LNGEQHTFRAIRHHAPRMRRVVTATTLAAMGAVLVAVEHGFRGPFEPTWLPGVVEVILVWGALALWGDVAWQRRPGRERWRRGIGAVAEGLIAAALIAELAGLAWITELLTVTLALMMVIRLNGLLARSLRNPLLLFPGSFLVLIAISTLLLKLPAATPPDSPIGWVDALFTATSSVCVTGLAVRDTATQFTFFGQAVVLGSIQLGGLGVMIFGSTLALLFGVRLSFKEHVTLSRALDEYPAHRILSFAWFIVLTTFALEAIGAGILYVTWPVAQIEHGSRLWCCVFHSVSAFCNAGFDITGQSMIGMRTHAATYLGVVPMIILGGLGFIVLEEVTRQVAERLRGVRDRVSLSTHSRVILVTTAALLVGGTVLITIAQWGAGGQLRGQTVLDALFMSTTARTAGFTSVPMDELSEGSRFTLMVLMSIGGSPGSTAGGMKTAVFAMLVLAIVTTVRGRDEVEVCGRALPEVLVRKAATVAAGLLGVIALATLVLDLTEHIAFEPLLFEVISAATTTGLSLGATDDLTPLGRVVIVATMFMGRVGALSLLAALVGAPGRAGRYRLPRDTISLG
jgi:trk system potassium uptake protein TrkH